MTRIMSASPARRCLPRPDFASGLVRPMVSAIFSDEFPQELRPGAVSPISWSWRRERPERPRSQRDQNRSANGGSHAEAHHHRHDRPRLDRRCLQRLRRRLQRLLLRQLVLERLHDLHADLLGWLFQRLLRPCALAAWQKHETPEEIFGGFLLRARRGDRQV